MVNARSDRTSLHRRITIGLSFAALIMGAIIFSSYRETVPVVVTPDHSLLVFVWHGDLCMLTHPPAVPNSGAGLQIVQRSFTPVSLVDPNRKLQVSMWPLFLIVMFLTTYHGVKASSSYRRMIRKETQRCQDCGYILLGLESPRCPECGRALVQPTSEVASARSHTEIREGVAPWEPAGGFSTFMQTCWIAIARPSDIVPKVLSHYGADRARAFSLNAYIAAFVIVFGAGLTDAPESMIWSPSLGVQTLMVGGCWIIQVFAAYTLWRFVRSSDASRTYAFCRLVMHYTSAYVIIFALVLGLVNVMPVLLRGIETTMRNSGLVQYYDACELAIGLMFLLVLFTVLALSVMTFIAIVRQAKALPKDLDPEQA